MRTEKTKNELASLVVFHNYVTKLYVKTFVNLHTNCCQIQYLPVNTDKKQHKMEGCLIFCKYTI